MDNKEYEPIIEIIDEIFGDRRKFNDYRCQIAYDCPVCSFEIKGLEEGDGKGNLEINYKSGVFKCWSCAETNNTHGSLNKLIKKYGTPRQLKKYNLLRPEEFQDFKNKPFKVVKLPKEFISFNNVSQGLKLTHHYKQAYNYLKKRNISDDMINKFNIGFCFNGTYQNRIIIPSYDKEGNLNYFIARSYLGNTKIKYKNPEVQKELIIWNEHLIDWNRAVYIVEGVFDSIFLPNSIPMLGKFMSDKLFDLLYKNAKKIIIVLDPDAANDQERLYHKLNCGKLMGKVYVIKLNGDKDIADLKGELNNFKIEQLD